MTEKDESNPHGVKAGQVWVDMDKRNLEIRYLRVTGVNLVTGQATVARVNVLGGAIWGKYAPRPIKLTRFYPNSSGYRLVKDVTP